MAASVTQIQPLAQRRPFLAVKVGVPNLFQQSLLFNSPSLSFSAGNEEEPWEVGCCPRPTITEGEGELCQQQSGGQTGITISKQSTVALLKSRAAPGGREKYCTNGKGLASSELSFAFSKYFHHHEVKHKPYDPGYNQGCFCNLGQSIL